MRCRGRTARVPDPPTSTGRGTMFRQIAAWWRRLFPPRRLSLLAEFRRFFGRDFEQLPTHDKYYPGYDIVSLNRALISFHEDVTADARTVGACAAVTTRQLF